MDPRNILLDSFNIAVNAANSQHIIRQHLPKPPKGRTLVVGAGKAAAAMALAVENAWPHNATLDGVVITRYGHALPTNRIKVIEAGHPIPDENSLQATKSMLSAVKKRNYSAHFLKNSGSFPAYSKHKASLADT